MPPSAGEAPVKIATVAGIESEGLVELAFVKLTPCELSWASAEFGLFFTQRARSSACMPSILSTSTRLMLNPWFESSYPYTVTVEAAITARSGTANLLVLFIVSSQVSLDLGIQPHGSRAYQPSPKVSNGANHR